MKKLLKLNEILLLSVGGLLDIFQEIKDPGGIVGKYYQNFYGFVPQRWKKDNFYSLVYKSLKTELIEKVEKNGEVCLQLTRTGRNKIKKSFPLVDFQQKRWDKKWRLVIFDIKETSKAAREKLRAKLKELGFGMVQKSVWISPHDVLVDLSEFINKQGFNEEVIFLETADFFVSDIKDFANKVWKIEHLNQQYENIFDELILIENEILANKNLEKNRSKFYEMQQKYLKLVLEDPFLPKEFLPEDWYYLKAFKKTKSLKKFLKNIDKKI